MSRGAQILVVEDDEDLRGLLGDVLRERGFVVECVAGGEQALAYLDRHPSPDVIVLDMRMWPMNGWEFLERKRHRADLERVPVLAASASRNLEAEPPPGVARAFAKPLDMDALMETLARFVRA